MADEEIITYKGDSDDVEEAELRHDENIYVVGHGYPGGLWTGDSSSKSVNLGEFAAAISKPIASRKGWTGEVRLLSCRSGVAEGDESSLATLLSEKLLTDHGLTPTIRGTEGYSYGTVTAGSSGFTSVLKPDKYPDMLYKGKYAKGVEDAFKKPAGGWSSVPNENRRKNKIKDAQSAIKAWFTVRGEIEEELKEIVSNVSNEGKLSIENTLKALDKSKKWKNLLTEQESEFTHYGLFSDSGFTSVTATRDTDDDEEEE
jgi:hypothetical protein